MLNGYKKAAWNDRDKHLYVPSTKAFSKLLNYDIPIILIPGVIGFGCLVAGVITLANGVWIVGASLLLFMVLIITLLCAGYSGSNYMGRQSYNNWVEVEKAYAQMSPANRKRHRDTLRKAFHDPEVEKIAFPLFKELGIKEDLSILREELKSVQEQKAIIKELGNG